MEDAHWADGSHAHAPRAWNGGEVGVDGNDRGIGGDVLAGIHERHLTRESDFLVTELLSPWVYDGRHPPFVAAASRER